MLRIGQSTDIHQLVKNRKLILGGVFIESDVGLLGHSDADVLVHVIIESIIGGLGLGDIGKHFSDKNPENEGISSLIYLKKTVEMMSKEGYKIVNLDTLIMIEDVMINPHILQMKKVLCPILQIEEKQLNIKATRGEKLGFVGRKEGAMAQAVVLLEKQ